MEKLADISQFESLMTQCSTVQNERLSVNNGMLQKIPYIKSRMRYYFGEPKDDTTTLTKIPYPNNSTGYRQIRSVEDVRELNRIACIRYARKAINELRETYKNNNYSELKNKKGAPFYKGEPSTTQPPVSLYYRDMAELRDGLARCIRFASHSNIDLTEGIRELGIEYTELPEDTGGEYNGMTNSIRLPIGRITGSNMLHEFMHYFGHRKNAQKYGLYRRHKLPLRDIPWMYGKLDLLRYLMNRGRNLYSCAVYDDPYTNMLGGLGDEWVSCTAGDSADGKEQPSLRLWDVLMRLGRVNRQGKKLFRPNQSAVLPIEAIVPEKNKRYRYFNKLLKLQEQTNDPAYQKYLERVSGSLYGDMIRKALMYRGIPFYDLVEDMGLDYQRQLGKDDRGALHEIQSIIQRIKRANRK